MERNFFLLLLLCYILANSYLHMLINKCTYFVCSFFLSVRAPEGSAAGKSHVSVLMVGIWNSAGSTHLWILFKEKIKKTMDTLDHIYRKWGFYL